jgi:sulfonate transport system substrate-binding protein
MLSLNSTHILLGRSIALLAALMLLPCCGKNESQTAPADVVTTLSLQPIPSYAPMWVAKEKGWLEEDLKAKNLGSVKWAVMLDGPTQNEAFAGKKIDVALTGDTPAIIGNSAGLGTHIISVASFNPSSLAILVPKDSPIKTVADLRGKKVGVTKGSFCHHLVQLALKNAGMTLDDIKFINMDAPDINTSLQTAVIDAGATWEPYITQLVQSGAARVLIDGTGIKRGEEVMVARDEFAAAHPDIMKIILQDYQRGEKLIESNPDEAAKLIADDVKLSPAQISAIFSKSNYHPGIRAEDIAEFGKTATFLLEVGRVTSPVDVSKLSDDTYVKAAGIQ